jgi:hypothetical protein
MESYVERWAREQKEAQEKQKAQKGRKKKKQKEVENDGENTRSEGQAAQAEESGRTDS